MRLPRSSGVLLPVFSLPGQFGIGDFGPSAFQFVDFLNNAGQSIWQLLPLTSPARGNSPYSSKSAFAGNLLFISPEELLTSGLLSEEEVQNAQSSHETADRVDYARAEAVRVVLLQSAYATFLNSADDDLHREFELFIEQNASWLTDFARFDVLASHYGDPDWSQWDQELIQRQPQALADVDQRFEKELHQCRFFQFLFSRQWKRLQEYARQKNVRLYGDMPIFVAYESADVWTNQHLFCLEENGRPSVVAGVPPDYFSETGQKWGNPLYRWDRLAETGYEWWVERIRRAFEYFDLLRIDHFRGFESFWEIPFEAENATTGHWVKGPGDELFAAISSALGELPIIAEDLGLITDEVHHLRDRLGFPGMRVLQFGCEHDHDPYHRPDCYPEHCVAYTGTHDNNTTLGWYRSMVARHHNQIVDRFLSGDPEAVHTDLIRAVLNSAADTVIIQMQDVVGLGAESRMNTPGVCDGNWAWRCEQKYLVDEVAEQLREMTQLSGRI